ncbi:MAG: hypothetical protein ACI9LV_000102 [Candidatus Nanohaloarchaea archaeon]|jgi:hypothetical protein
MVIQLLSSFAYSLVENSWMVSTIAVKYFLFIGVIYAASKESNYVENFKNFVEDFSGELVSGIVVIGLLTLLTGTNLTPVASVFSHLVTVTYFGYLFWEF